MTNGGDTTVRDASTDREEEGTLYRQLGSGLRCEEAREADIVPDIRWKWGFEDLETGGIRAP